MEREATTISRRLRLAMRPEPHIPHSAPVLYSTAELPRRLAAIDQIEVYGVAGHSSLRRTVNDTELLAPAQ